MGFIMISIISGCILGSDALGPEDPANPEALNATPDFSAGNEAAAVLELPWP